MSEYILTGPDGTEFDIKSGPIRLSSAGIMGLSMPPFEAYTRETAALDGQVLTGYRTGPRTVFLPLLTPMGLGVDEWLASESAFWKIMDPEVTCRLTVSSSADVVRFLDLRFVGDGDLAFDLDPTDVTGYPFGLEMVADKPFWRGPLTSKVFQTAADTGNFYAPPGSSFVFTIGSASTVAGATVSNPGDTPAWPTHTVYGPAVSFSINVGGSVISATLALAAGEWLTIDTNPTAQIARKWVAGVGTIVPFFQFSSIQFAQIPRGGSVPVDIVLNGAGSVQVAFSPQYRRAF
ncbi:hypothetical protein E3T46_17375 [Cryobacterium sp. Hh11]|uniref:hypothetical protein n=1 Tax=Cryobacterium sp. Hh11 TaxID=2555868 RepID=UPI00106D8ED8|nr:hypothetical protein [Cryobacterium sp. Hh11]TFD47567.1 hypothetical protein E3T46_17375 [Cryobacterium sp. Hh11]